MRIGKKVAGVLLCGVFAVGALAGCNLPLGPGGEIKYPDFPLANAESDSWTQIDASDKIEINWFVDIAGWNSNMLSGDSVVAKKIREKTGVTVNFIVPLNDDGSQLNTLISSNKLPDVVTLNQSAAEQRLLAAEGYLYPLDGLAERWAPTLLPRINHEIREFFEMPDGYLYGLPQDWYTQDDLKAYEQQGGHINPNGAVVARKDYLEAYLNYAVQSHLYDEEFLGKKIGDYTLDTSRKAAEYAVTRASNFAKMAEWVKKTYGITNADQTVLLNPFNQKSQTYTGNKGIKWLYEFFNVQQETPEGNLPNQFEDPRLKEMMDWLNGCYRSNLITNLGLTSTQVGQQISAGKSFCFIGSPQDFTRYFATWNYHNPDSAYIPVVLTNDEGETPQLTNLCATGFHFSMITRNCSRPDRVIKLFDFLFSEEGQNLIYYGVEAEGPNDESGTFYWQVKPGETKDGIYYKYGQAKWTDTVQQAYDKMGNTSVYGMGSMYLLGNRMYAHMAHPAGEYLNGYYAYTNRNVKAALTPYSYNHMYMQYNPDVDDPDYTTMIRRESQIYEIWYMDYFIQVIKANSAAAATALFNEAKDYVYQYGWEDVLAFQNRSFLKRKARSNVKFGWPPNDPDSGYDKLFVYSIFGVPGYEAEVPNGVGM